ncbi:MAG TPA: response regulator [Bryobacteraceae bacterium]|nr:response regulator [Bryobacteraceae bacterium]
MSVPRILIIEDNPADIRLLRQALDEQHQSYVLQVLTDGEAAIAFLRDHCAAAHDPCLIVLDLHLPRYDGLSVLRAIRSMPSLAGVRVAVLTTIASPAEEAEVRRLGVSWYAKKPADLDAFLDLGRTLIQLCHDAATAVAALPT